VTAVGEPLGRIGLSICEDFWHPSVPMIQSQDGASLLVNLAAGPARAPGSAAGLAAIAGWHKMQETYALLGTVAVAFCNRVGNEEGLTFWGGSRLIGANGAAIAEAPLYEEALVVGSLDTEDLRMQRYQLPILADERLDLTRRELDRIIAERAGIEAEDIPEEATGG
jgi:predicted amidohydrolase